MPVKFVYVPKAVKYEGYIPKPIYKIINQAKRILDDNKLRGWIWDHTRRPEQYDAIIETLQFLANLEFVQWIESQEEVPMD